MLIMIFWFVCMLIRLIVSEHVLNSFDLTCKKREYRLITDQTRLSFTLNKPSINIHVGIGSDDRQISSVLTEFWYEHIDQQSVILQSSKGGLEFPGELDRKQNHTWNFRMTFPTDQSDLLDFNSKSIVKIQSTLFEKPVHLLLRSNPDEKGRCVYSKSSLDFATCCHLCSTMSSCSQIKLLLEHTRYDIIVTNRGLMVPRTIETFREDLICSLFPTEQINRFWSTITDGMDVDQYPDHDDFAIVQYSDGIRQNFFHYAFYPFHSWTKQLMSFHFLDVLFVPHRHWAIFELNECQNTACKLFLQIFTYQLNSSLQFDQPIFESIIEENVSTNKYFRLYFHRLSNILYLIGTRDIYTSNNYGQTLTRIWTSDIPLNDSIILHPLVFANTGHIAFIYQMMNDSICCQYFAVFSRTGFYHAWRTRLFRSSIPMDEPFFFDSTGSLFFNTTTPVLVILAAEQTLLATSDLLVNDIPGRFFVRDTDLKSSFELCSFSPWENRFTLVGSTIQIEKLGLFFVIQMQRSTSPFAFCLETSRLDDRPLQITRQCSLNLRVFLDKIHLKSADCIFTDEFNGSTIITENFPSIFIEQVHNQTFAVGRIFQVTKLNDLEVQKWYWIRIPKIEQILDRCFTTNIDENRRRPSFISLGPTTLYPLAEGEQLVTKQFQFLLQNDYKLIENDFQLLSSPFNHRKAILQQEFLPTKLSCYLPVTRTITFVTKCLTAKGIRPKFQISDDLPSVISIEPPINFQLNRYEAGFPSVIVYNLAENKSPSICDGWKNCSCISSSLPPQSIHCAKQIFAIDSTVNNRVFMRLEIDMQGNWYTPQNGSVFLIEEVSQRRDFRVLDNRWTKEIQKQTIDLFTKNFDRLTDGEIRIFHLLSSDHQFFLGSNLHLEFQDEGLYHFRLTYLWNDQFCLTSTDLLILIMSNTPTLPSYLFNYLLACIFLLIIMTILWIGYAIFHEQILPKYIRNYFHQHKEKFFTHRSIDDSINVEILMKIREQSYRLLPYKTLINSKHNQQIQDFHRQGLLQQHIKQLVQQFQSNSSAREFV